MKVEKPPGPPPFDSYDANKFETAQGAISGVQISLQLCNICTYQDRLFVVIFGSNSQEKPLDAAAMQNLQSSGKKAPATPASSSAGASTGATGSTTAGGAAGPSQSSAKWIQLCRTEVRVVTERPSYSESYVGDVKIFFNVLESLIPESCKEIKIVVYRQENNDVNVREGFKTANADLNTQLEIARTIIQKKVFDFKSILKIKMKVKMQLPVDIAVPLFKDAEVTLGMVKLTSFILQQHRQWMTKSFKISPYSEILYSFGTNAGMTLSLEQLYASRYATAIGQSMLQLFSQERHDYLQERIRYLKENFASAVKEAEVKASQNNGTDTLDEKMGSMFEPYKQAIEAIDEMFHESCELSTIVLNNCENVSEGREVKNNVIPVDIGGGILRRSVWKKITAWQYCTTNLNIHMLMNKYYCFHEIETQMEVDGTDRNIHYIPSITLGCPAAHELGFSDGGLRRVFAEVSSVEQKLHWMQAIQYPTLELVEKLFQSHPKEALSLFGAKCGTISTQEELANTLRRKGELSRRLDMVGCQALGCAVAIIRTTCMLATIAGGNHFDCLARSLKIGFLVMFQSFLSTQGAEIGMIEDLEMSALWLSLITVRLVTNPNGSNANKAPLDMSALGGSLDAASPSPTTSTRKKMSNEGKPIYSGVGDGIITRRDEVSFAPKCIIVICVL